jgi:hypothetical protein
MHTFRLPVMDGCVLTYMTDLNETTETHAHTKTVPYRYKKQYYGSDNGDDSSHEEESGTDLLHLMGKMDMNLFNDGENETLEQRTVICQTETVMSLPSVIEKQKEHGQLDSWT